MKCFEKEEHENWKILIFKSPKISRFCRLWPFFFPKLTHCAPQSARNVKSSVIISSKIKSLYMAWAVLSTSYCEVVHRQLTLMTPSPRKRLFLIVSPVKSDLCASHIFVSIFPQFHTPTLLSASSIWISLCFTSLVCCLPQILVDFLHLPLNLSLLSVGNQLIHSVPLSIHDIQDHGIS